MLKIDCFLIPDREGGGRGVSIRVRWERIEPEEREFELNYRLWLLFDPILNSNVLTTQAKHVKVLMWTKHNLKHDK